MEKLELIDNTREANINLKFKGYLAAMGNMQVID